MATKYTPVKRKTSGNGGAGKYNPNHKPEKMSLEEWQRALRIQVAKKENLRVSAMDNV